MRYLHSALVFRLILAVLFLSFVSSPVWGDRVVLSNGDRVTGTVMSTRDKKVIMRSALMGDVAIPLKEILSLETNEPVTATFTDGGKVLGTMSSEGQQVRIMRDDQSEVTRTLSELESVRDARSQRAYERELERQLHPGWLDFWSLEADLGLASAQGNAETTTFTSGALARRITGFDETTLNFEQIYSTQRTREAFGTTANAVSGSGRYRRNLVSDLFIFGAGSIEFNEFQNLDLGTLLGGGFGWHIIRKERHSWDTGAGGNWYREKFSTGLLRNSGEANFHEESSHKITRLLHIYQGLYFFPNLSESGQYRFRARVGADFKLSSFLAFTLVVSNKYLSKPLPGNKKSDTLISTGIQFRWAQN